MQFISIGQESVKGTVDPVITELSARYPQKISTGWSPLPRFKKTVVGKRQISGKILPNFMKN